jgi:hypothetical protein
MKPHISNAAAAWRVARAQSTTREEPAEAPRDTVRLIGLSNQAGSCGPWLVRF